MYIYSRGYLIRSSNLLLLIDVDFRKRDLVRSRQTCGELFVERGNLVAWCAPCCVDYIFKTVSQNHHHESVLLGEV